MCVQAIKSLEGLRAALIQCPPCYYSGLLDLRYARHNRHVCCYMVSPLLQLEQHQCLLVPEFHESQKVIVGDCPSSTPYDNSPQWDLL